ncbi:MFS transporter [Clostridium estertheticum]|uniref:MFS transporter n=1 Tax=Clostridium estertheticum TaxID=238834 RepID=UPI00227B0F77|nr:MFS transporter [Clostridium estertheticum]WAG67971.1 MFS transporter [Clostridium estertheticum]
MATDIIPKKRFGEGMGCFSLSSSLAMALAPAVALYLLNVSNFRNVAILAGGLGIFALILSFFIKYNKVEKEEAIKERVALYEKISIGPSIVIFFVTASYGAIVGFIFLYALEQGIKNIGVFFTVYAVSLLITRPFLGKMVDRLGFNKVIYPGLIILVISMVLLSYASSMPYFIISAFLYGIGFGSVQSSLQTMAILNAPKARFGAANATFFTGFDGGIGFGSVIAGIVASAMGYSRMYLLFSIFLIIAIVLYFIIMKTERLKSIN